MLAVSEFLLRHLYCEPYSRVCVVFFVVSARQTGYLTAKIKKELNRSDLNAGMPMGSQKKTSFCGEPVCVAHVQGTKGSKIEAPKRLRERNMFLYSVRNYLLEVRQISEVDILVQKKNVFPRKIDIPVNGKKLI